MSQAPFFRPRRLRATKRLRDLFAETHVRAEQLIMPHFVLPAKDGRQPIASMPGIERYGWSELVHQVAADLKLGIHTVLLFGLVEDARKDVGGSAAFAPETGVIQAVRALKQEFGADLVVMSDVCLCAYTDHGHCGVMETDTPDNDKTLPLLARMAHAHAEAGTDVVAPSDMMDGRVRVIREELDANGFTGVSILSYAVKYASAYYGPFRDAAESAPGTGDRSSYQMDYRNSREAEREIALDEAEGADAMMVKPALAYLDVVMRVRSATSLPVVAYNVSGEYAQLKAAAERGWVEEALMVRENLTAMVRAGAGAIVTYHARDALRGGWL